jgi:toxin ParE1/3/4
MAGFRISRLARADLQNVLAVSLERWGEDGQARYLGLLEAAFEVIASDPEGPVTRDRSLVGAKLRSFHVRHARRAHGVHDPVHIIYYRWTRLGSIEVVRILHERMDPTAYLDATPHRETPGKKRRS